MIGLIGIAASSKSVLLASSNGESESSLILCSKVGIPITATFVPFRPDFVALTTQFTVAVSGDKLAVWPYQGNDVKYVRLRNQATAIATSGSTLLIAYASHELVTCILSSCEETAKYTLSALIESIALSSDLTQLSLVDEFGNMTFLDVHSGTISSQNRRETWLMKWAEDCPDLFVSLERQK
jgi:hypothetical protein